MIRPGETFTDYGTVVVPANSSLKDILSSLPFDEFPYDGVFSLAVNTNTILMEVALKLGNSTVVERGATNRTSRVPTDDDTLILNQVVGAGTPIQLDAYSSQGTDAPLSYRFMYTSGQTQLGASGPYQIASTFFNNALAAQVHEDIFDGKLAKKIRVPSLMTIKAAASVTCEIEVSIGTETILSPSPVFVTTDAPLTKNAQIFRRLVYPGMDVSVDVTPSTSGRVHVVKLLEPLEAALPRTRNDG